MHQPNSSQNEPVFFTTRWTMVMRARGDAPEARAALSDLCEIYWAPVHQFLRREGRGDDDSRELTQEFFSQLLAKNAIGSAEPGKGRFRSYLLGALKHFLANERRAAGRLKRGGDAVIESIDGGDNDISPGMQAVDPDGIATDAWFDRHWALAVMERGLNSVRQSFEISGKGSQFKILKPWLMGDGEGLDQSHAAAELGMTNGAIKVAIHRLRQKFGEAIRMEIAETVDTEEDIAGELRYLIEALRVGKG